MHPIFNGMNALLEADRDLFFLINNRWSNSFFDTVMPVIRTSQLWVPLYLFLLVFVLVNFKTNRFWWIFFVAGLATITDFVSSDIIKPNFFRVRPCNEPEIADSIRLLLSYRPQSSSFTSSHAVNHFALGTFFFITLKHHIGRIAYVFMAWALIIIYAQVYVGVHYPLDVICGAIIGAFFGYLSAAWFNKAYGLS